MARTHTKLVAPDGFDGSPALNQKLTTSPHWANVYLMTTGTEFYGADLAGSGTSDAIEYRDAAWAGTRQVAKYLSAAPAGAEYTAWAEYGGQADNTRLCRVGVVVRVTDSGANWDGYALLYTLLGGSQPSLDIWKIINASSSTLASYPATLAAGDTLALEVAGAGASVALKGYLNDTPVVTATDSSADRIVVQGAFGVVGAISASGAGDPLPRLREWRLYEAPSGPAGLIGPLGGRRQIPLAMAR